MKLAEIIDNAILECLARHEGRKPDAAKELGIALQTVYNHLNRMEASGKLPRKP